MSKAIIGGIYRHYKGDLYIVDLISLHTETQEELVIYHKFCESDKVFARPRDMFESNIKIKGKLVERFSNEVFKTIVLREFLDL